MIKMDKLNRYNVYSDYLKNKYGEKVYKLPVNIPVTCPNRDGKLGEGGCIFCSDVGAGFESHDNKVSINDQLIRNKGKISKRYGAKKFIAYFQNFSNTYLSVDKLYEYLLEVDGDDIVEICISTRPDCISDDILNCLMRIKREKNIEITLEIGLQSVNYRTLKKLNRGHGLGEFIDAITRINKFGFEVCVHLIANLPWDDIDDMIEAAKILSSLNIKMVKIHSLYILKGTVLGEMYINNEFEVCSVEEYVEIIVEFMRYASKDMVFQRFLGRAPEEDSLFCNWNTSWWKIKDMIDAKLEEKNASQGDKSMYLNGKALY